MNRKLAKLSPAFRSLRLTRAADLAWISANVELERLKTCLLSEHMMVAPDAKAQPWFKSAVDEADSMAWATTYPFLVFPVLLEEKLNAARPKNLMQKAICPGSRALRTLTE